MGSSIDPRKSPTASPCVGRCSHNVGDDVCRGCGRLVEEVRDWGGYSDAEKIAVKQKAEARINGVERKSCSACGSTWLIKFSSVKHPLFERPGYMRCGECDHEMPWHLDDDQLPLVGSNRQDRKTKG